MSSRILYNDDQIIVVGTFGVEISARERDRLRIEMGGSENLAYYASTCTQLTVVESGNMDLLVCVQLPFLFEGRRSTPKAFFQQLPLKGLIESLVSTKESIDRRDEAIEALSLVGDDVLRQECNRRGILLRR